MQIRLEEERDRSAVHAVNYSAFETRAEADLVDVLREQAVPHISLIAEDKGTVIGHIMFSPVSLSGHPKIRALGLAPMAVTPRRQRQGIGTALVEAGLEHCKRGEFAFAVVLGHPRFYPRFGFRPAGQFGIDSEYEVPSEVFLALELEPGALKEKSGKVRYHAAFNNLS
ncbi:MAG TPA: N-acetyltransferase [Planctomycetes bacterium]|nr:N-acetyltransferase [Planctomycetota bacterium]HIL38444.1 N-acetyltransferase [Planctomycetota bacterium]